MLSLSDKHLRGPLEALETPASQDDQEIHVVELQFNFITSLSPSVFTRFTHLISLNFGGNELTEIPNLRALPRLQELFLNNNKIEAATNLEYLPELRVLDLRANRITDAQSFACSPTLTRLSLACNQLTSLPTSLFPALVFVSIFGNNITHFDTILSFLAQCPQVEEALCSGNPCCPAPRHVHEHAARVRSVAPCLRRLDWAPVDS
eukprot:m.246228 g.246228  ORF g.246228 m.246228 type:complete len:206 (+) comp41989_c0_seq1:44-661(+)